MAMNRGKRNQTVIHASLVDETIDEEESNQGEDTSNFIPPDATTALAPREINEGENDQGDQPRKLSFI
jgi:hypothetical protein